MFGDQERQIDCLRAVQARVAVGVVAVGQRQHVLATLAFFGVARLLFSGRVLPAFAAALAQAMSKAAGPMLGTTVAVMGVWILFKTQLDQMEGLTRAITDILWTGSSRVRAWRGGDVRLVYYTVMVAGVSWGAVALKLAQPFVLLQLSANMAGVVFVIAACHLLYLNCTILPVAVRPPLWRRVALVVFAGFYAVFVTLWVASLVA